MKLQDQVCSLELAKKLKDLGVKQESLYGWSLTNSKLKHNEVVLTCAEAINHPIYNCHLQKETYVSAFTVAELGELIPPRIKINDKSYFISMDIDKQVYYEKFRENKNDYNNLEIYPLDINDNDNEADSRAKMLIHLLENGLIENDLL